MRSPDASDNRGNEGARNDPQNIPPGFRGQVNINAPQYYGGVPVAPNRYQAPSQAQAPNLANWSSAHPEIEVLRQAVQKQQAWIDAQPERRRIEEGLALLKKDPLTWGRILKNTLFIASGVAFTAIAAPYISTASLPVAILTGAGIPTAIAKSAIAAVTPALAVTGMRVRRAIKDATKKLEEKYGQSGKEVIVEGKGWRALRMTGRSATIDIVAAALLVGGLMEMNIPGLEKTPAQYIRDAGEAMKLKMGEIFSMMWAKVRP